MAMTNGDDIRAMDDETLARFLHCIEINAITHFLTGTPLDTCEALLCYMAAESERTEE